MKNTFYYFGSCRINRMTTQLRTLFHDPGTILQEIKAMHNELIVPEDMYNLIYYTKYRTHLLNDKMRYYEKHLNLFNNAKCIIIEISTLKSIIYNNIYLDLVQSRRNKEKREKYVDNYITDDITLFENNVIKLIEYLILKQKKICICGVVYWNSWNIEKLKIRNVLNNVLEKICKKYNVTFINPTDMINENLNIYPMNELLLDSDHFTKKGEELITHYIKKKLNN